MNRTIEANDEGLARIRFVNSGEVAFQPVEIVSIAEVSEDTTVSAKSERVGRRKVGRLPQPGWRDEAARLTDEIEALAEKKMAAARKLDWDKADALQEEIRGKIIKREQIVKANGPGAARS